jgi:superfamily II DNA helicase RecQ
MQLHVETVESTVPGVVSDTKVKQAQSLISDAGDSHEAQERAIKEAIQLLYPYEPREGQVEALHYLIYYQRDLILIAKTSFGKSMILQSVSVLLDKKISIIILPLDQIGKEQAEKIACIGGRPCFLNADTISDRLLKDVSDGKYTHILMSPELAVSDRLRKIILEPRFKDRLALVVVDEAHLVQLWGVKFRTDYARLNLLRSLLGRQVPWYACSATLDSSTLDALIKGIGFDADIKIQRTSIDCPELLYQIGFIPRGSRNKYSALRFLFDGEAASNVDESLVISERQYISEGCRDEPNSRISVVKFQGYSWPLHVPVYQDEVFL